MKFRNKIYPAFLFPFSIHSSYSVRLILTVGTDEADQTLQTMIRLTALLRAV